MNPTILNQSLSERAKAEGLWHSMPKFLKDFDQLLFDQMKSSDQSSSFYWLINQLSHKWPGIVIMLVFFVFLFFKKNQGKSPVSLTTRTWDVVTFFVLIGVGNMLSDELKDLFARLKPHVSHDIPNTKQPLSFPSNHSFNTASILAFWHLNLKWSQTSHRIVLITILTLFWFFTAWSRIFLGEHFPLDVIAGLVFGFTYGLYGTWLLFVCGRKLGFVNRNDKLIPHERL